MPRKILYWFFNVLISDKNSAPEETPKTRERNEQYMSSAHWLEKNSLKAKRLGFYDILAGVAFKHCDGVLDLNEKPHEEDQQTDAVSDILSLAHLYQ